MLVVMCLEHHDLFRRPRTDRKVRTFPGQRSRRAAENPRVGVGMCVWVPTIIEQRPSSQWPMATFRLVGLGMHVADAHADILRQNWLEPSSRRERISAGRFNVDAAEEKEYPTGMAGAVLTTVNRRPAAVAGKVRRSTTVAGLKRWG